MRDNDYYGLHPLRCANTAVRDARKVLKNVPGGVTADRMIGRRVTADRMIARTVRERNQAWLAVRAAREDARAE